jgi:predicted nucleic acid-binding protein
VTEAVVDAETAVATDTSLLLNFLRIDRTDILSALPGFGFQVLNHVVDEVTKEPHASRLQTALHQAHVVEFELTDLDAIADYNELRANLGDGEAATIAAGAQLHWIIGLDEKGRAKREAIARVGEQNLLNTPGILVHAVRAELLTVQEAEQVRLDLAVQSYRIKSTIADLL